MQNYEDVLKFVEEENIRFIRLAFFDVFGNQKNIAIMPGELQRAFRDGISFDASAIAGRRGQKRPVLKAGSGNIIHRSVEAG